MGSLERIVAPASEPVTLAAMKQHLRQGSTLYDDVESQASIAPGNQSIAAAYSLAGSSVTVTGYQALAILTAGAVGAGGSFTVKLQHRNSTGDAWADVTSGAFTTVNSANDEATFELAYTGTYAYLRAVATVAGAACNFGVSILLFKPEAAEDTLVSGLITTAREYCEELTERSYVAQTWELTLDDWPANNGAIKLLRRPISAVSSVKYTDSDGTETTLVEDTDYIVSLKQAKIVPAYGESWPSATLYPIDAIAIRYTTGGTYPERVKSAIKLMVAWLYTHRGDDPHNMDDAALNAVRFLLGPDSLGVPFA